MTENHLLERGSLRQSFNQAALSYDSAAGLQRKTAKRLLDIVSIQAPHTVLDLGCGTGYGSHLLEQRFQSANLISADLALGMVQSVARAKTAAQAVCADALALPFEEKSIDLLWSNLMLQWCNDLPLAFVQFNRVLSAGGSLAFSTFGPATLQELKNSFDDGYTHVSRFVAADVIEAQLHGAGFVDVRLESRRRVVHYEQVLLLMRELKSLGASNATQGRARGLTGRKAWQRMLARYEATREDEGLPSTYELIYVTANKPGHS
jgi:malonyl-CoA O-methyltransferase